MVYAYFLKIYSNHKTMLRQEGECYTYIVITYIIHVFNAIMAFFRYATAF